VTLGQKPFFSEYFFQSNQLLLFRGFSLTDMINLAKILGNQRLSASLSSHWSKRDSNRWILF
jgi:hypothetical protein